MSTVAKQLTDTDLVAGYQFVLAFETLRKQHGCREMNDVALQDISNRTGARLQDLRTARSLRNALAHGDPVNPDALVRAKESLDALLGVESETPPAEPSSSRSAYRVHAWRDPQLEQEMLAFGFVAIGGEEIGDLSAVEDAEFIRSLLTEAMPDRTTRAVNLFVGYWRRFLWEAQPGDLCVLPTRDRHVTIGEFVGPYHYVESVDPRARHRRNVAWSEIAVERASLEPDLLVTINGQHTVQEFRVPDAAGRLLAISDGGFDPGPGSRNS